MIYFVHRPDPVFTILVDEALSLTLAQFEGETEEGWRSFPSEASRCFSMELARSSSRRILEAHRSDAIYQLSDYLWLLLYESLEAMCEIHNEDARSGDFPGDLKPIGEYRFRWIDFDMLLGVYFWDLDFLPYPNEFTPAPGVREAMGMSDEVFGIHRGLEPHGDELRITPVEPSADWGCAEDLFREGSTVYPDPPDED